MMTHSNLSYKMYKCMYKNVGHFRKIYEAKCSSKYKIAISHENAILHNSFY